MKKEYIMFVFILFGIILPISANVTEFKADGIFYKILSQQNSTVELSRISVSNTSKSVVVPETVIYNNEPFKVISIADKAFDGKSNITEITVSNSVERIGSMAFANCMSLVAITLPDSLVKIGDAIFYLCN